MVKLISLLKITGPLSLLMSPGWLGALEESPKKQTMQTFVGRLTASDFGDGASKERDKIMERTGLNAEDRASP